MNTLCSVSENATIHKDTGMMKEAYTITEVMEAIGIGRTKLYEEIGAGKLSPRKIGSKTIVLADDLKRYLNALPKQGSGGTSKRSEAA